MKTKYAGKPATTYINASEIQFSGIKQQFIATMAPKPNTVQNFWQMIIDKKLCRHKDRLAFTMYAINYATFRSALL